MKIIGLLLLNKNDSERKLHLLFMFNKYFLTVLPYEKRLERGDLNQDQTQDIFVRLVCKQISRDSPK